MAHTQSKNRLCSYCECTGHNRATCVFRLFATSFNDPSNPPLPPVIRICSYCNCSGHDLRNCLAHQQLSQFHPEIEDVSTPDNHNIPHVKAFKTQSVGESPDLSSVSKNLTFNTPSPPRRAPRHPQQVNIAIKSIQMIDPDIYDEPWVWCPPVSGGGRPIFNRAPLPNPPSHFLIFT